MRITFVLPFASLSGGIRVVAAYARALTEAGHDVWVVSRPKRPRSTGLQARVRRTWKTLTQPPQNTATPLLDFLGDRHIVLDRFRPVEAADVPDADAVIATWWETAPSVAAFPPEKGRKFYLLQDYETFDNLPVDEVAATYHLPLRKIAVSSYIRDCLVTHHGVAPDMIDIIPNAVDTTQFDAPPRSRGTPPTIGFLFQTHPRKRVELAIEAIKLARAARPDLQVIAFGKKRPDPAFGLPGRVDYHVAPPQAEIPRLYAACDMWLFTSRSEGFGLPLLEALACRTPVLATRAGAAPDLIDDRNGRLLDPTPEAFAGAICQMADLPDTQWQAMSAAAHQTAHRYGWAEAAARLAETLRPAPATEQC